MVPLLVWGIVSSGGGRGLLFITISNIAHNIHFSVFSFILKPVSEALLRINILVPSEESVGYQNNRDHGDERGRTSGRSFIEGWEFPTQLYAIRVFRCRSCKRWFQIVQFRCAWWFYSVKVDIFIRISAYYKRMTERINNIWT